MGHTACLVCMVSTVSGCHKNAFGKGSACSGHKTKLEQCTFLQISMKCTDDSCTKSGKPKMLTQLGESKNKTLTNGAISPSKQLGCQQKSMANLISKISLFLNVVKHTPKNYEILRIPNLFLFFVQLGRLFSFQQLCNFSLSKSCKT